MFDFESESLLWDTGKRNCLIGSGRAILTAKIPCLREMVCTRASDLSC